MDNKQLVRQFYEILETNLHGGSVDMAPLFTDDVSWHLPQSTGIELHGKAAVLGLFSGPVEALYKPETMQFIYHSIIADGEFAHCHFSLRATTASNKPYNNHYQSLFLIRDGKIAEVWEYFDTAYLFSISAT